VLLSIALSPETVLLTGRGWFRLNTIFLAVAALVGVRERASPLAWLGLAVVTLAVSLIAWRRWVLFKPKAGRTALLIEGALRRVLLPFRKHDDTYQLLIGTAPLSLEAGFHLPGLQVLKFDGDWHQNKARLAAALLAKQFRGVFPVLKLRV